MNAIKLEHLTKRYKDTVAVDDLSLSIRTGELFSLLGVNGAGKTTTIKMLCTLTAPTSGDATLGSYSVVKDAEKVKPLIGVSPQETAVAPLLTVRENLELLCKISGFDRAKTKKQTEEMLQKLGLKGVEAKRASALSGGFARRLSLAMALIGEPEILFLDEPTLGLDVLARRELWEVVRALKGKITIVLTTHYMEEAEALSDRIAILKNGRLKACDTPENLCLAAGAKTVEEAFIHFVREDAL